MKAILFRLVMVCYVICFSVIAATPVQSALGKVQTLYGIWGSSASDIFAVGTTIMHYDGTSWSTMTYPGVGTLEAVWGSSGSDVFAVGYGGAIIHYDGTSWSTMTSGTTENLNGVWGSSGNDVFAVGENDTVVHYNGSSWSTMTAGSFGDLFDVWGISSADVYASGEKGTLMYYDGSKWTGSFTPSPDYYGVWFEAGSDVYVAGDSGFLASYNGSTWNFLMSSPTTETLWDIWGSSGTDVFAVGNSGTIIHYNGSSWSSMTSGIPDDIHGVWGSSANNVYAVSGSDAILVYNGSTWSNMISSSTTTTTTVPATGGNTAPTAMAEVDPPEGPVTIEFTFVADQSTDAEDPLEQLTFRWDFDTDGNWDTEYDSDPIARHRFDIPGEYTATLEVKDTGGLTDQDTVMVMVSEEGGCVLGLALDNDPGKIEQLRSYRDQKLAKSRLGRIIIRAYYRSGPQLKTLMEEYPVLRGVVGSILNTMLMNNPD